MPPRKKLKGTPASTPLATTHPPSPLASPDPVPSAWDDEQEIQLFKSMIKWKPTGLHKHFRIISIHASMTSHGFATEKAPHTRIPGIWKKLHTLYDLDVLDARENDFLFADEPDPLDPAEARAIPDFALPEDDFGELMWRARFRDDDDTADEVASSPPLYPINDDRNLYVPGLSLPHPHSTPHNARLQPAATTASQRASSAADAATPTPRTKTTRASRASAKSARGKGRKAQDTVSEDEDEDEESEDEEDESEDSAPTTRRTARGRGKPAKRGRKR
jgi:MRG-binding protein